MNLIDCLSLQATRIRNTILRVIRNSTSGVEKTLPADFVYTHPTIGRLSSFISSIISGAVCESSGLGKNNKLLEVQDFIKRYTKDFPVFTPSTYSTTSDGRVILITGATGSLGSNILSELLKSKSTEHIYVLSRRLQGETVLQRLSHAFIRDGLDPYLLKDGRLCILEGDTSESDFSVGYEVYLEVRILLFIAFIETNNYLLYSY